MNTRRHTILYSSWMPEDSGGGEIARGIEEELTFAGYRVCIPQSVAATDEARVREEAERIRYCIENPEVAGLVLMLCSDQQNLSLLRELRASGKALVFLERTPQNDRDFDWVAVDNTMAARQVVESLISQGHRSIAHITANEAISSVSDRHRGYRQALERAGIRYRPEMVVPHQSDWRGIAVPAALLKSLLCLPNPPTAIFAVHDWVALLTMLTGHHMGLHIPRQLAVAGFDGIERFRKGSSLLTSVETPFYRMGIQAARLIDNRLSGRVQGSACHVQLEAPLQVRFSTQKDSHMSLLDTSAWRRRIVFYYLQQNLEKPLTVEDLAAVVRVSVTTLFHDFQEGGYQSPMQLLLSLRLEQIHRELSNPEPGKTVSHYIDKWGINHQGRFASCYRNRYGETPSETLRAARCRAHSS